MGDSLHMSWRTKAMGAGGLLFGGVLVWVAIPGTRANYLIQAAAGQVELLAGRVDVDEAIEQGLFTDDEVARLRMIKPMKEFGKTIGLGHTANYDTINPTWDKQIWNVSGSQELRFRNARWWFPIVGSVPYLGYFDKARAEAQGDRLRDQGYDVMVRKAGAYSTLGWFRDPVLPAMLGWREYELANTVLHELAHATLWLPGSVQFNESFAQFVGNVSSDRYMVDKYGEDSKEVASARGRIADRVILREVLHRVYGDLDTLYKDKSLSSERKRTLKHRILTGIPTRLIGKGLHNEAKYVKWAQRQQWNNARLLQFRTYNRSRDWFEALLEQSGGDLPRFMAQLERITASADDPYEALADAVGATPLADAETD